MLAIRLLAVVGLALSIPTLGWADTFDYYTNTVLTDAVRNDQLQSIDVLTPELIAEHFSVLPDASGAFVVVQTNDRRFAKLLIRSARVKVSDDQLVALLLVERFTTYREATERAVHADNDNLHLYAGFRLNLDHGQIVPEDLGGDVMVVAEEGAPLNLSLKPVGEAKMYLLTEALPNVIPKNPRQPTVGAEFSPTYFTGTYQLHDDGRRSGELQLEATEEGDVTGSFYSDKDGQKYEVAGKVGTPRHTIRFTIKFPRTVQTFDGFLFTGDAAALTGSSTLEGRVAGFYAVRMTDEE